MNSRRFKMPRAAVRAVAPVALAILLAGCATSGADIRVDYDRSADFYAYKSYAFVKELGTDRAGYSTLITTYFREAVDREMRARGYQYSEDRPDLLVNFFADAREVTAIKPRPNIWVSYGYYGYRYGMYHAWPIYAEGTQVIRYKVGTANVDVIDARRRQLIWEGVAEGRLTHAAIEDPRSAISAVVADLFTRYPRGEFTR